MHLYALGLNGKVLVVWVATSDFCENLLEASLIVRASYKVNGGQRLCNRILKKGGKNLCNSNFLSKDKSENI